MEWDNLTTKEKVAGGIVTFILGLVLLFGVFGIYTVKSNEVGVKTVFGEVVGTTQTGVNWNFWLTQKTYKYSLATQELEVDFESFSSDGQAVNTSLSVQFQLDREQALEVYNTYGSYENLQNRFRAVVIERAKSVFSERTAMTIVEERGLLSTEMLNRASLVSGTYLINITNISLVNLNFTTAFEQSIEDKMIAEQQQLQAEYTKEQAIIKAQQEYEVSLLNAQAVEAIAQGEANALIAIASANAESIRMRSIEVARMLGFSITTIEGVEYIDTTGKTIEEIAEISAYLMYVTYMETWDGILPEIITGDTTSLILPTN